MMGRSRTGALLGLLQIIKDPAAAEAHIAKINEAESAHQASMKTAREELSAARKEIKDQKSALDVREKNLSVRESNMTLQEKTLKIDQEALRVNQERFAEFEAKTSANLSARELKIEQTEGGQAAAKRQLDKQAKDLADREQAVGDRERAVKISETEHLTRAAKLREALK